MFSDPSAIMRLLQMQQQQQQPGQQPPAQQQAGSGLPQPGSPPPDTGEGTLPQKAVNSIAGMAPVVGPAIGAANDFLNNAAKGVLMTPARAMRSAADAFRQDPLQSLRNRNRFL